MRLQTVQIAAGLLAAVAFVIAFIAAGIVIVSSIFALIGSVALAWLVYSIARRILSSRAARDIAPTT